MTRPTCFHVATLPVTLVMFLVLTAATTVLAADAAVRPLQVDLTQTLPGGSNPVPLFCVGGDRAAIYLRPSVQRDLAFAHDQCGFKYIRFHGLLDQEMQVVTQAGPTPKYNWTNVDAVYDFLLKIGMKPFVELGFMPEPLASGKDTIFYYKGNTTPPASYAAWGDFITALTRHFTDRYGVDEVKSWYFEVWNEPNLTGFWHGTKADYFHLYDVTSRAVKSVNADYRVGGPSTAGLAWLSDFLSAAHQSGSPVDFVSGHQYGVHNGFLDENGNAQQVLDAGQDAIVGSFPSAVDAIRHSPFPDLQLFISEWSTSYSCRDPVHDSYLSAAYILSRLKRVCPGVAAMSYWTFSDQFEEAGPVPSPFHGGFGLLNAQGLPKPAFFAYRFLNQLGPTPLACDDADALATTDPAGDVRLLLWNYTPPKQNESNQTFYARDWPTAPAPTVHLQVQHLPPGDYTLNVTRVGYRANDVYTAYVDLGKPAGLKNDPGLLNDPDYQKLKQSCTGQPESTTPVHIAADGSWPLVLNMRQNDVCFITLTH